MMDSGQVRWTYRPRSDPGPPPSEEVGGKAHHLARLSAAGAEVPTFIAIRTHAFETLVMKGLPWPTTPDEARTLQDRIEGLEFPESFRRDVSEAIRGAGLEGRLLAVRSSAVGEDGRGASFAGQFRTVLGVSNLTLWDAIRSVWKSAFDPHALAYGMGAGSGSGSSPRARMGVVVQEMVDAAASGVTFSVNPVTGRRDTAVVSAIRGLGEPLVSGDLDGDTFQVRFPNPGSQSGGSSIEIERTLRAQKYMLRLAPGGGTNHIPLGPGGDRGTEPSSQPGAPSPVLDDEEVIRIARIARELESHFDSPQDVEWALVETSASADSPSAREPREVSRRLVILQARPITALPPSPEPMAGTDDTLGAADTAHPQGERRVWDNSNIIESYSGVTTPLTFSFVRSVYNDVYTQFCRLLGVSEELMVEQRHVFANMLGLLRGRVYYNLLNWYRLIALLPGYAVNRDFMERMMGVGEALPDPPEPPKASARWRDLGRVLRMLGRMVIEYRKINREVAAFHARLDRELDPLAHDDLGAWTPDALVTLYRHLETSLLHHWRAPLVNDFFAMIFFGLLGRLTERWLPGEPPTLANDLLCGEGGVISTEPARRVMALARQVRTTPALLELFQTIDEDAELWDRLTGAETGVGLDPEPGYGTDRAGKVPGAGGPSALAEFHLELTAYLDRFGNRCMNELKLETVTPHEDPTFLVEMIRAYVQAEAIDPEEGHRREAEIRAEAEARVRSGLRGPRRWIYRWILKQARDRIRDRENLRFERTRVFGIVRRIFTALGGHLARTGVVETPDDVFYLTMDETFAHIGGTGVTTDLRRLVTLRREEFDRYRSEPDPPDRFETLGPPVESIPAGRAGVAVERDLVGLGCCPGRLTAPVRVVHDPRNPGELQGHILVADRTDPGWTLLFPRAVGILVERGSLLSHSAIVAREMGLPCVVGVTGLMDTLEDGEMVEMDGTHGTIRRMGKGSPGGDDRDTGPQESHGS